MRPNWDEYFLSIAKAVATRSTCRRRQVGAVLTIDNRIVATGYNGSATRQGHCVDGYCPRGLLSYGEKPAYSGDYSDCTATHAEINAFNSFLAYGNTYETMSREMTLYVTDEPCGECEFKLAEIEDEFHLGMLTIRWPDGAA